MISLGVIIFVIVFWILFCIVFHIQTKRKAAQQKKRREARMRRLAQKPVSIPHRNITRP